MSDYSVDRKHWATLSIFEQMGNIYSEVGRSFSAQKRNDNESTQAAITRAIDLFDATTDALIAKKSVKVREVLRSKDQYLAVIYGNGSLEEQESLEKYFLPFAIAARLCR